MDAPSHDEPHILVRQSPRALDTELRFASRPVVGGRTLISEWRDVHNRGLTAAQAKREGKVASLPLSDGLLNEYTAHRAKYADSWQPLVHRARCAPISAHNQSPTHMRRWRVRAHVPTCPQWMR